MVRERNKDRKKGTPTQLPTQSPPHPHFQLLDDPLPILSPNSWNMKWKMARINQNAWHQSTLLLTMYSARYYSEKKWQLLNIIYTCSFTFGNRDSIWRPTKMNCNIINKEGTIKPTFWKKNHMLKQKGKTIKTSVK